MELRSLLSLRLFGLACVSAAAVTAVACAGGAESPTAPSVSAVASTAPADSAKSPGGASARSGTLQVTKQCSGYTGLAGSFCTITSSDVKAVEVGSRIIYLQPEGPGTNSDVVLDLPGPGNNQAFGHCTVAETGLGVCTFSGGTGKFRHFEAEVAVSYLGGVNFAWNGSYGFSKVD
jgi:hypothetical protein